jgi:hypothetical protein
MKSGTYCTLTGKVVEGDIYRYRKHGKNDEGFELIAEIMPLVKGRKNLAKKICRLLNKTKREGK